MKKIIGIDFDGTCVTDLYPYVGDNIGAASVLRELGDKNLLILYTVRDGKYLQDAVDWFRYNHINQLTFFRGTFDPCVSKIFYSHIIDLFNLRASDKARVSISFFLIISLYLFDIHFYYLHNKFLSDPDQKKFCFKGYYYVEVKEQDDKELSGLMGRVVYK